jgi:hypothetical protein
MRTGALRAFVLSEASFPVNVDILLLIAVGLLLLGVLPLYPYSNRWGYTPSALLAVVFVVVLVLVFL